MGSVHNVAGNQSAGVIPLGSDRGEKMARPIEVVNLPSTLDNPRLVERFREYLRVDLDRNRNTDKHVKKKMEQWLDFVIICQEIYSLEEDEVERRTRLMVEVGERFLAKPTQGYNMALNNQQSRLELERHCKKLKDGTTLDPDTSLLRDGYKYIFDKLASKHDLFKRKMQSRTPLYALMCALL